MTPSAKLERLFLSPGVGEEGGVESCVEPSTVAEETVRRRGRDIWGGMRQPGIHGESSPGGKQKEEGWGRCD